ncbi:lipoprotein-anchoring transpeptidase ErfK/SrfK [Curtobacterium luteum]|uniref:Lipoprotein-anchoring transpeptidase ErfK/SrfK n=1 Tax=Curtobacterium luteum TaxID=33881 RepID=A0A8H9GBL4_9MICO|nr:L,D-transpeptidase [Curtobacterium luteum]MBM7803382.1 lipoprotein-anchoring transpeptidase ErfK/SrfK [Curtobacterium luteum]NUU51591.1 L,D-transpeptidase [Curtobacterium luteum]GGL07533.1 hypothetical protein GCM10009769_27270 [Curtobacterium luteum]
MIRRLVRRPRRHVLLAAAAAAIVISICTTIIALAHAAAHPDANLDSGARASATPHASSPPLGTPSATGTAAIDAPTATTVAAVTGSSVAISTRAGAAPTRTLQNPQPSGAPLVFRVVQRSGQWLEVLLPVRPNGSTGWIRSSSVSLSTDPYAVVVTVATHTLDLYNHGRLIDTYRVATGTGGTPTPRGRFALTELLQPSNSGYGPYAYGTTAFSDVLNSFGGGPGQIGLHGTDDTSSIGRDGSHGCVRMRNADITALARLLPLGTPFQVR